MAKRNYLIEGSSGTGKSTVWEELRKRGYKAINGDRELAYRGDPETGRRSERQHGPREGPGFGHHIWDVDKVRAIVSNTDDEVAFFCGGSRNFHAFIGLFDKVFVLDVDIETLRERLDRRTADDWDVTDPENSTEFVLRLHVTKEALPEGIPINTARPISEVVDTILACTEV
jgi:broad-specificity NMP kinase